MNLVFSPLPHQPSIKNAIIPVKEGVRVSVSKGRYSLGGYVGSDVDYQCAIQVNDKSVGDYWDLVFLSNGDPAMQGGDDEVNNLVAYAKCIVLKDNLWVFDSTGDGKMKWSFRFTRTNALLDSERKQEYATYIWGSGFQVLPLGVLPAN